VGVGFAEVPASTVLREITVTHPIDPICASSCELIVRFENPDSGMCRAAGSAGVTSAA
jgi:hypothetical protein